MVVMVLPEELVQREVLVQEVTVVLMDLLEELELQDHLVSMVVMALLEPQVCVVSMAVMVLMVPPVELEQLEVLDQEETVDPEDLMDFLDAQELPVPQDQEVIAVTQDQLDVMELKGELVLLDLLESREIVETVVTQDPPAQVAYQGELEQQVCLDSMVATVLLAHLEGMVQLDKKVNVGIEVIPVHLVHPEETEPPDKREKEVTAVTKDSLDQKVHVVSTAEMALLVPLALVPLVPREHKDPQG